MYKMLFTAAASALLFASTAQAELVTNGGFEAGSLSGWTQSGQVNGFVGVRTDDVKSGTYRATFGTAAVTNIAQTLATMPGETYNVSFWLRNFYQLANPVNQSFFQFNWDGGAAELTLQDSAKDADYVQYTYSLLATTASTELKFSSYNKPSFFFLDDVSVTLAAAASPTDVPEPMSLALVGVALAGAAAATRRKRS